MMLFRSMKKIHSDNKFTKISNIIIIVVGFFLSQLNECHSAQLSSVSFLFEMFSPYAMIRFFEFSDKDWNISENCLMDMYQYLDGLRNGSLWAIKLYDATAFYSGGLYGGGTQFRIHNPQLCRNLQTEYLNSIGMNWNLTMNTTIPFPVQILTAKYEIHMPDNEFQFTNIQQLICFPKNCIGEDLSKIISGGLIKSNFIVKNMTFLSVRQVSGVYDFTDDGSFYILACLILTISGIFIFGHFTTFWRLLDQKSCSNDESRSSNITVNDLECAIEELSKLSVNDENLLKKFNMHPLADSMTINNINTNKHVNLVQVKKVKTKNMATISLDIIAGNCDYAKVLKKTNFQRDGFLRNFLNCFSLSSNFHGLTTQSNGDGDDVLEIATVRGLQVICSVSMMLMHTYTVMAYLSNNQLTANGFVLDFLKMCRYHSTFLIDMFFFLSGTNLSHLYLKTSCNGVWHVLEQLLHFLGMITQKICSIILSYTIILICLEIVSKHFYDNSPLEIPSVDHYTCDLNKWRNVLYIDTFFPVDERCMPWAWYISLEVQFFIAGCLVLLLAQIHPKYAGAICIGLFISSIVASTALEMVPPIPITNFQTSLIKDLTELNLIYDKNWIRIPPYLLGMCFGYILYKIHGKFHINIFIIIFGWLVCFLILIGFICGFQLIFIRINPWIRAGIITLAHTLWCLIICWMILASISQYGGLLRKVLISKLFCVMGKLSNGIFLLGPLIIRAVLLNGETGIYLSGGQVIIMFLGFLLISYGCALILYLLFEAPLLAVLRIINKRHYK